MTSVCVSPSIWLCMVSISSPSCMCTCQHVCDGHKAWGVRQAVLCILSVHLENTGQRTSGSAWSPCLRHPNPGPRPGPCFSAFRREAKPKASPEPGPDLGLVLG